MLAPGAGHPPRARDRFAWRIAESGYVVPIGKVAAVSPCRTTIGVLPSASSRRGRVARRRELRLPRPARVVPSAPSGIGPPPASTRAHAMARLDNGPAALEDTVSMLPGHRGAASGARKTDCSKRIAGKAHRSELQPAATPRRPPHISTRRCGGRRPDQEPAHRANHEITTPTDMPLVLKLIQVSFLASHGKTTRPARISLNHAQGNACPRTKAPPPSRERHHGSSELADGATGIHSRQA